MPDEVAFWPEWLVNRLTAAGLMDAESGATRKARAVRCKGCRRPVMRGIDRDFGGQSRDVDPQPLSGLGEALALLAGRRTFELRFLGNRYEIDFRDDWRIRGSPANTTPRLDVLVEHNCTLSKEVLPTIESKCWDTMNRGDRIPDSQLPDMPPF